MKIAVCDDDKNCLDSIKRLLAEYPGSGRIEYYQELSQLSEALENGTTYDLVLMDVQMPVMNGYEATREIRALADPALAGITILAMTANAFDEDRKKAMKCGMDGFLSKPIVIEELISTLHDNLLD